VLTDRIDLDDQISKTFVACGLPNPRNADRWRACAMR
jgi:type I restriction enzyme R subunit